MSMPLDNYAANGDAARNDTHNERGAPIYDLARELMRLLGDSWEKDESRPAGVRLTYGRFAVEIEPQGHGVVSLTCVMPEPFLPAITSWLLFADGAVAIAREIREGLIPRFVKVTDTTQTHADAEAAWKGATLTTIRQVGELIRTEPKIDVERDPGLRISALYRKDTGDSLRIDAAPGGAPIITVHIRNDKDIEALVYAWHALDRGEAEEPS
jgi:hypothetical protein